MEKRIIRKEDGRYLIFYAFDRPLPQVIGEHEVIQTIDGGAPKGGTGPQGPAQGEAGGGMQAPSKSPGKGGGA